MKERLKIIVYENGKIECVYKGKKFENVFEIEFIAKLEEPIKLKISMNDE